MRASQQARRAFARGAIPVEPRTHAASVWEQKRLAKAVALAADIAELASELRNRNQLIANLEFQVMAAKRTPAEVASLVIQIEAIARKRLRDLRSALADRTSRTSSSESVSGVSASGKATALVARVAARVATAASPGVSAADVRPR